MRVELFYFDGCPSHQRLIQRLPTLLEHAGITSPPTLHKIIDDDDAQREHFLGSPSLRVDGRDIEPGAGDRDDYGLKCRIYQTADGLSGLPPDEWILAALNPPAPTTSRDSRGPADS